MIAVLVVVVVVLVITAVPAALTTVPAGQTALVERLGRFRRVLTPGVHVVVPLVDKAARRLDMRERLVRLGAPVACRDDRVVKVEGQCCFQVTDPTVAGYALTDLGAGVEQLLTTTLRNIAADTDAADMPASHRRLEATLREVADRAVADWGIQVTRLEVTAIHLSPRADAVPRLGGPTTDHNKRG